MERELQAIIHHLHRTIIHDFFPTQDEVDPKRPLSFTTPRGTKHKHKGTTIFEMARCGDCDGINELIEKGQDVNERFFTGWTALMDASMCGQAEVVKLLLAKGADKEIKNTNGFTALMLAPNKEIGTLSLTFFIITSYTLITDSFMEYCNSGFIEQEDYTTR